MKKAILFPIVIMFLIVNSAMAQQYYPFQTDTAKWSVASWWNDYPNGFHYETNFYFINGDTLFNNLNYAKIYRNNPFLTDVIDTANSSYIGALREDENKYIYFKPASTYQVFSMHCQINNDNLDEFLLYRFDVNQGDVFYLNDYVGENVSVLSEDSVLVGNQYRRKLMIGVGGMDEEWVEGIGAATSLFGNFCPYFESGDQLLCYEDSGTFYFGPLNPFGRCTDFIVGQEENRSSDLTLSPNPAHNTLKVYNSENQPISKIIFYDQLGNLILQINQPTEKIDISRLASGMYLVEIVYGTTRFRQKLVVE